jgi:hypothetical protein
MSATRRAQQNARLERRAQRFHELKRGLDQLEYFCKGTVLKRMMKCGKAACACHSDPDKRHGPYFELTYKANGKTVNVKLAPEAAPLYKAASLQYRKAEDPAHSPREALTDYPPIPSQTGPVSTARLTARNRDYPHIPALSRCRKRHKLSQVAHFA